jgi:acetyl-CoA carboxylase biotin carboxyl carrier protein
MTIEEIKELLEIFNQSGVGELEVERGGDRVRIRRNNPQPDMAASFPVPYPVAAAPAPVHQAPVSASSAPTPVAASPAPAPAAEPVEDANTVAVKSPIVGTYYECPSPGAPPFVKIGDRVAPGQVLCIIESMKLMNEIEAETAGVIVSKLVENGKPVEYGQALFTIRPN